MDIFIAVIAGLLLAAGIVSDTFNLRLAYIGAQSSRKQASPIVAVPTICYIIATSLVSIWLRVHRIHPPYLVALLVPALGLLILFDFVCTFGPFERRKQL